MTAPSPATPAGILSFGDRYAESPWVGVDQEMRIGFLKPYARSALLKTDALVNTEIGLTFVYFDEGFSSSFKVAERISHRWSIDRGQGFPVLGRGVSVPESPNLDVCFAQVAGQLLAELLEQS